MKSKTLTKSDRVNKNTLFADIKITDRYGNVQFRCKDREYKAAMKSFKEYMENNQ